MEQQASLGSKDGEKIFCILAFQSERISHHVARALQILGDLEDLESSQNMRPEAVIELKAHLKQILNCGAGTLPLLRSKFSFLGDEMLSDLERQSNERAHSLFKGWHEGWTEQQRLANEQQRLVNAEAAAAIF